MSTITETNSENNVIVEETLRSYAGETCDSCGPAVRATFVVDFSASELAFCNHHYNKNKEAFASNKSFRLN